MANANEKRGLVPFRHLTGGEIRTNSYTLKSGQTAYKGDLLSVDATGAVVVATANDGVKLIGVAAEYKDASAAAAAILVYDDPMTVFLVQEDGTGTAIAAADAFSCANHVAGAGDTVTKLSGHKWNQASIATTAKDLKLIGLVDMRGNAWGAYAKLEVVINNHFLKGAGAAGI